MRTLRLGSLLPAIAASCLAACGGESDGGNISDPVVPGEPQALICAGADSPSRVKGLAPTLPVDYLALYSTGSRVAASRAVTLLEEDGTRCSGATDPVACEQAMVVDPEPPAIQPYYWDDSYVFLYTRGSEVGAIRDVAALRNFLGTIDTPNEAAVILWSVHRDVSCGTLNEHQSGYYARGTWEVSDCPFTDQELLMHVARNGEVSSQPLGEKIVSGGCAGRRPSRLEAPAAPRTASPLGDYFAHIAHLEAAAVAAFAILERELIEHDAPRELIAAARTAAEDEVRHSHVTARLARRFGAEPPPVRFEPRGSRTLLEIALDNAVEGCVRETYGALQAHYQARSAADPEIRDVLSTIAVEETTHAELSHTLHGWLMSRLAPAERRQVEAALRRAVDDLRQELSADPNAELVHTAGVPDARAAARLIDALAELFGTIERHAA